jgi:hypothetical protein
MILMPTCGERRVDDNHHIGSLTTVEADEGMSP